MKRIFVFTSIFYLCLSLAPAHAGLGFMKIFLAKTHPSCTEALPAHDKNFCPTFKATAKCTCTSAGLPGSMCDNMNSLHKRMLTIFSSQLAACKFQQDTTTESCLDSWNCYRVGGKDSHGHLCQTTGAACA